MGRVLRAPILAEEKMPGNKIPLHRQGIHNKLLGGY
jgi:hypothetical protein